MERWIVIVYTEGSILYFGPFDSKDAAERYGIRTKIAYEVRRLVFPLD